jgi:hypothetical protein
MRCSKCNTELLDADKFCNQCGTAARKKKKHGALLLSLLFFAVILIADLTLWSSSNGSSPGAMDHPASLPAGDLHHFVCPPAGCEVATDMNTMIIIVLHETDTPGDNGLFDSTARSDMYRQALQAGKIITVDDDTLYSREYQTPVSEETSTRYSVVTIRSGRHAGLRVITRQQ